MPSSALVFHYIGAPAKVARYVPIMKNKSHFCTMPKEKRAIFALCRVGAERHFIDAPFY